MSAGGDDHANSVTPGNYGSPWPPFGSQRPRAARGCQGRGDRRFAGKAAVRFDVGFLGIPAPGAARIPNLGRVRTSFARGKRLVGALILPASGLVYLDANPIIFTVEKHSAYG